MRFEPRAWIGLGGVPPHDNPVAYRWEKRLHWVMASIASAFIGEDEKRLRREMHHDIRQLREEVARMVGEEERAIRREMHRDIRELREEVVRLRGEVQGLRGGRLEAGEPGR